MPRENVTVKAARLVRDGRLHVTRVDGDHVHAVVHGEYQLGHQNGRCYCDCPKRTECAYLIALQRVATACPACQPISLSA